MVTVSDQSTKSWVGGPNFVTQRQFGSGPNINHPVGRRKTRAYPKIMCALAGGKRAPAATRGRVTAAPIRKSRKDR